MKEISQEVLQTIKNLLLKNVEQLKVCSNCGKIMYKGYNIDNERYYCSKCGTMFARVKQY